MQFSPEYLIGVKNMRARFQVLIILYRIQNNEVFYCVFKRSDIDIFQFISGGGEDNETLLEAAKRETFEETGIISNNFYKLESETSIRKDIFKVFNHQNDFYVVKEYSFALKIDDSVNIKLSEEHTQYIWGEYNNLYDLLKYDSNKTALWELNERIKTNVI